MLSNRILKDDLPSVFQGLHFRMCTRCASLENSVDAEVLRLLYAFQFAVSVCCTVGSSSRSDKMSFCLSTGCWQKLPRTTISRKVEFMMKCTRGSAVVSSTGFSEHRSEIPTRIKKNQFNRTNTPAGNFKLCFVHLPKLEFWKHMHTHNNIIRESFTLVWRNKVGTKWIKKEPGKKLWVMICRVCWLMLCGVLRTTAYCQKGMSDLSL